MHPLPATSRELRLKVRPASRPKASDFEIVEVALPVAQNDEVLVRNRYSRVSASLRMMISEGAEAIPGVPFPALKPGDTLAEETLGEVLSAPPGSELRPGDRVRHFMGWREYAAVPLAECVRVDSRVSPDVASLSHGSTAYAALTRGVEIRPGDTVLITSAAGAIGSMAGQIARQLGAGRVIGSTSSRQKAERLVKGLGYDAAVIRGSGSDVAQLREVAPEGIDVVLDCVGGEQLQSAIVAARPGARIAIVGALSGQLADAGTGREAPVELDSVQILLKKITIRGYSADDDPDAHAEWDTRFAEWLQTGDIVFPHVIVNGIERAPEAIQAIAEGRYFGTVFVEF
ncbi:NADP-dependent oxidoreductase [Enterobacter sp. Cy-643]|uniref:MDR family NADP-dependent oxidoreductase n=1 Tax=Enterobacter sp. Cy-643 TaxID=2608346 RepID=UPI00142160D3|nr:NADP-dependent oxidoreductase [Enterobacter sp. Cy-643]